MTMHIQDREKILVQTRKHWFVLVREALGTLIAAAIPPILVWIIFSESAGSGAAVLVFASAAWLLLSFMAIMTIWTNYILDVWTVTDRRVIHTEQVGLFKREVATLRMERVQDIKVETHGIIESLLNFGTLKIESAGPTSEDTVIKGLPDPSRIRNVILERVDLYTEKQVGDTRAQEERYRETHSE